MRVPGVCAAHCRAGRAGHVGAAAEGAEVAAAAAAGAAARNHPATCRGLPQPVRHSSATATTAGVSRSCYRRQRLPATSTAKWYRVQCVHYTNKVRCSAAFGGLREQLSSAASWGRHCIVMAAGGRAAATTAGFSVSVSGHTSRAARRRWQLASRTLSECAAAATAGHSIQGRHAAAAARHQDTRQVCRCRYCRPQHPGPLGGGGNSPSGGHGVRVG